MGDLGPDHRDGDCKGKRTPIDPGSSSAAQATRMQAAAWLARTLGKDLDGFGFKGKVTGPPSG